MYRLLDLSLDIRKNLYFDAELYDKRIIQQQLYRMVPMTRTYYNSISK